MMNYTLTLTKAEILDIRMALIAARVASNNDGHRFMALRNKIIDQKSLTLTLTRAEVGDIRMALIAACAASNNGGHRFMVLRDKIIGQQKEQKAA